MKKRYVLLFIATMLLSTTAFAREFYKAKVRVELRYSSLYTKTRTLAKTSGTVLFSDDGENCIVVIKNNEYRCFAHTGDNFYGDKEYDIDIKYNYLMDLLLENLTTDQSYEMISRIQTDEHFYDFASRVVDNNILIPDKKTVEVQLHTDDDTESFHLKTVLGVPRKQ